MVVLTKPKIDNKTKILFDRLLTTNDKTLPLHFKFIKNMSPDMRDMFMNYFSFTVKYDLKEYDLIKRQFKNNDRLIVDKILDIVTDYKDGAVWKTNHIEMVRGIQLGTMYQIKYKNYKHDPFPLAIFLNSYDSVHQNFQAINLHYFIPPFREFFVKHILKLNKPRILANQAPILTLDMIKPIIPDLGMAYRNYKAEEIKVIEKISDSRWETYLQIDRRTVKYK